jgi:hypothetical protein
MKKIWSFLKHHIREDFNYKHYGLVFLFLILSIYLNYRYEIEDVYLETFDGFWEFVAYFIFYSISYYFSVLSYTLCCKKTFVLKQRMFWIKSAFGIGLLSLDSSVPFLSPLIDQLTDPQINLWAYKVTINAISFFTVFLPILIFYYYVDKKENHVYGLNAKHFDTRPYFAMLLLMLPLLISASFSTSFLRQYPMYKSTHAHEFLGVSEWVTVGAYEFVYGLDFVTVEYLFRGFLVIGMMSALGRGAVLSMAVIYCFLHFGKPMGEAISSIFGGYILGVVAYETRSVWGGIIVHIGIAWLMELIAFVQKSL